MVEKVYKSNYGEVEVYNICYENVKAYFYENASKDSLYIIEKKDTDKLLNGKDIAYFTTEEKATQHKNSYITNEIKRLENLLW